MPDEVLKGSGKLAAQLASLARLDKVEAATEGAQVIVDYMQTITPVDTGELRDSEEVVTEGDSVSVVAGTDHAAYVEFGTYKMEAQPYFRPALDTQQKPALKAIAENVNDQMKDLVRRA
jgi:HK97 gp10 family phage protein